jgi:hypothetical protein
VSKNEGVVAVKDRQSFNSTCVAGLQQRRSVPSPTRCCTTVVSGQFILVEWLCLQKGYRIASNECEFPDGQQELLWQLEKLAALDDVVASTGWNSFDHATSRYRVIVVFEPSEKHDSRACLVSTCYTSIQVKVAVFVAQRGGELDQTESGARCSQCLHFQVGEAQNTRTCTRLRAWTLHSNNIAYPSKHHATAYAVYTILHIFRPAC